MDLQVLLNTYNKSTLQVIGRHLGIAPLPKDRTQLIDQLVQTLSMPQTVERALAELSTNERAILEQVQLADGELSVGALRLLATRNNLIDKQQHMPTSRVAPVAHSRLFEEVVARLTSYGLLFTTGQRGYGGLLGFELLQHVVIASQVLRLLPPLARVTAQVVAAPPTVIQPADPATFQRDLYLYWSYIRDNKVTLTSRSLVNKSQLKKINALLSQSEPVDTMRDELEAGRLRLLRHVLLECGLIERAGDHIEVTASAESFFAKPLALRTKAVFDAYRKASFWDELLQIPCLVIEGKRTTRGEAPPFVIQGRGTVLDLLVDLPAKEWLSLESIIERVRRRRYEFLLSRRASSYGYGSMTPNPYVSYGNDLGWSFYYVEPGKSSYEGYIRDEAQGWDIVEAGFIQAVLSEPLYWLGLIDLGLVHEENTQRLTALRFSSLGAHLLLGEPLQQSDDLPGGRLIVQPTFQVLAYPPVSELQLALLDRIAERGRLEQVAEYRLTRESLYRARQQHGLTAEQVMEALQRESGAPLPQNVAYTLSEWGQAQERVVLHEQVTLLTVAEATQLDAMLADEELAPQIVRRLTPTAALVRNASADVVEQTLLARGQLPLQLVHPPDLEAGGHWIAVSDDGQIAMLPGAPALYLRRELRVFSAEQGAALRITRAGVRQAIADGVALETLLERLALWSGGALSQALETQIKTWGGFFGSAQIERPVLLRLEDERVLAALLEDPDLAPLLHTYQPTGVLAEIDPAHVDQISALLASRGMALSVGQGDTPSVATQAANDLPEQPQRGRRRKA